MKLSNKEPSPEWTDTERAVLIARMASKLQADAGSFLGYPILRQHTFELSGKIYEIAIKDSKYLEDNRERLLEGFGQEITEAASPAT